MVYEFDFNILGHLEINYELNPPSGQTSDLSQIE